jgi:hypothetical protein
MSRRIWMLLVFLALGAGAAHAVQLKVSLSEVSQTADLIFVGTVTGQSSRLSATKTMPVTDVSFGDIEVIHATPRSTQRNAGTITLTYAGGRIGETTVTVSDTPTFVEGRRYLVFLSDDGQPYLTPIVGGPQGQFEVLADRVTGASYLLTADGHAVVDIAKGDIVASPSRVTAIESGVAVATDAPASESHQAGDPVPARRGDSYRAAEATGLRAPMLLSTFLDYLRKVALKEKIDTRRIRRGGVGQFYREENGSVVAEPLPAPKMRATPQLSERGVRLSPSGEPLSLSGEPLSPSGAPAAALTDDMLTNGASLYWCGQQGPPAVMEQVSSSWWEWGINNYSMWMWNQIMDVFRYTDDDGTYNWQNVPFQQSEFIGYPSSADLASRYGSGWGATTLAVTWTWNWCHCCAIQESDLAWNPAYSWTDSFSFSLGNNGVVLQRPNTMHELGHTIGHQREDGETYDYDQPSVMHAYYSNVVEDGYGVHEGDAWIMRRNYQNDRSILGFADMGVESYYASNGLHNATASPTWLRPGDWITVSNVTVENISYGAQSDVRLRFFLSTDKTINTADLQMGSYWYWSSFCGECYNVGSYGMSIPSATPPGTYYVGAIVTRNGFGGDDYWPNDQTFLFDTITVTCSGSYWLSPTSNSVLRPGEIASLGVNTTGGACGWSAADDASWITITSGASGIGSGTVGYRVAANTGPARTGHIYAAGLTHTVTQQAGCLTSAASPIGMWGSVSGVLSTSDCLSRYRVVSTDLRPYADHYTFSGTAGHRVAILATSGAFDGYLYLVGPTGTVVAFDDDGAGYPNPRIPAGTGYYTLPSTGTYTIEVTSYSVPAVGAYTLKLMAPVTLTISPAAGVVTGCRAAEGKIVLGKPAPAGGLTFAITDTLAAASPPSTVTIAAGALEKSFTIPTTPVLSTQSGTVTARFGGTGGVSSTDGLSIRPISVDTLTLTPNPVVGPNSSIGAIVLECNAGPQAITVSLGTTNASVASPAVLTLTIPVGTKNRSFTVRTANVSTVSSATIKATANGRTKTKTLTVQ